MRNKNKKFTAKIKVYASLTAIALAAVVGMAVLHIGNNHASAAVPANFVYRSGNKLMLNGAAYKFVGFNAYGMTGCETGSVWTQAQIDTYFKSLPPASVTRIWAFQQRSSNLDMVVARAEAYNQKLVMTLGNGLKNCEYPSFDDKDTSASSESKGATWFQSTYKGAWTNWVNTTVAKYKNSPAVGMWEVSNEAGHPSNISVSIMKPYFDDVAAKIKAVDSQHLVSTGALAPYTYGGEAGYQQIHSSSNIDVVSFHEYDGGTISNHFPTALKVANALNKPLMIGETGTPYDAMLSGQTRANWVKARFDAYLAQGAAGVLLWNYGQGNYGGWTVFPGDATATMTSSYKISGVVTTPTTPTPTPVGCTVPSNYGTVTKTISAPTSGTYKIWSRIMAPDATSNSFSLDIDGTSCIVVGDSSAISANVWTWVNYKDGSTTTPTTVNLSAGNHTFKVIGRESGVKVDRVMALADQACVPSGTGNNCTSTADAVAPAATINAPENGSTVRSTVTVSAAATDSTGVTKVEFYIDNKLQSTVTAAPYTYQWNTAAVTNGAHNISVKAYDAAGNIGAATSGVTVANGDTQTPTVPTNVSATANAVNKVTVTWTASTDNIGVSSYLLTRNGAVLATVTGATSYVDNSVAANTQYSYQVSAQDAAGNKSNQSSAATVTTPKPATSDTQAPSVPTGVLATPVSVSQINLTWTASTDNVGVTSYDVYRAAPSALLTKVATVNGRQYGDSGLKGDTTYTYYVIAKDAAGNQSAQSMQVSAATHAPSQTVKTGILRGVVTGNRGKTLNGVTITLWSSEGKQYTATTNASGVYRFSNLPQGAFAANYHVAGYRDQQVYPYVIAGKDTVKDIKMSTQSKRPWWQWWR